MSKIFACLAFCLAFTFTCDLSMAEPIGSISARRGSFDRFVMVVPAYRELYNQNIATMLLSLYEQNLEGLPFEKIDVWIVVNNAASVHQGVRIENQETVQFLRAVAKGKRTSVNKDHRFLLEVLRHPIRDKLNIHILDQTSPGNLERNIGAVRDAGVRAALASYGGEDLTRILVAHMDADTVFNTDYVRSIVNAFTIKKLKFGLLNLSYTDQLDSELKVYQRKITSDYQIAAHSFRLARDGSIPVGGSPRIVSTADALKKVKGVPHETVGEDGALIQNLQTAYPKTGLFLDIPVYAKFRAREDGYDAAIYLQDLDRPVEFTTWQLETTQLLEETETWLQRGPILRSLYNEAFANHLREHRLATLRLKSLVGLYVHDQTLGAATVSPTTSYPALLENAWFKELVNAEIKQSGPDIHRINLRLEKEFPYFFAEPAPAEIFVIARMKAATEALLSVPFLDSLTTRLQTLPSLAERFPETARTVVHQSFIDLDVQWRKNTHPAELGERRPNMGQLKMLAAQLKDLQPYAASSKAEEALMRTKEQMRADFKIFSTQPQFLEPDGALPLLDISLALGLAPDAALVKGAIAQTRFKYDAIAQKLREMRTLCPTCRELSESGLKKYKSSWPVFESKDLETLIEGVRKSRLGDDPSAVLKWLAPLWETYLHADWKAVPSFSKRVDEGSFEALRPFFHPLLVKRRNCAMLFSDSR